jgi:hypothetical protein
MASVDNDEQPTRESFEKDVARHEMTVLNDNGVYRHIEFRKPDTNHHWFGLTTWEDYLVINGDMGCFVFSRWGQGDMFNFFGGNGEINPSYWHEKLQADSRHKEFSSKEFSAKEVASWLRYEVDSWLAELNDNDEERTLPEGLWAQLESEIIAYAEDGDFGLEERVHDAIENFEFEGFTFDTSDYRIPDFYGYTYYYLWCLHAITWGIAQYRAQEQSEIAQGTGVSTKSA